MGFGAVGEDKESSGLNSAFIERTSYKQSSVLHVEIPLNSVVSILPG